MDGLGQMMRTARERLASERGSVGVVVALVVFLVLGMLTMTWNTAELSKAKMRLQNAADSAALAHAIWQARGMNVVQNINDEMYESLDLADYLRTIGAVVEGIAQGLDVAAEAAGPFGVILKGIAIALHTVGVLTGGTAGWIAAYICNYFLVFIEKFYAFGASPLGYFNAQLLAAQNGADPLARGELLGYMFGLYSIGFSWPILDAFVLPLGESKKEEVGKRPWKSDAVSIFDSSTSPWKQIYNFTRAGKAWEVKPMVSKRGDTEGIEVTKEKKDGEEKTTVNERGVLPGPTMWMAFKLGSHIHTMPLDGFWNPDDSGSKLHKVPMFAVSAAQCITGDVVPHSKEVEKNNTNQRPEGFGTGATAKLVPVSSVFYQMGEQKSKKAGEIIGGVVDAIIYH